MTYRVLAAYFREGINALSSRSSVASQAGMAGVPTVGEIEMTEHGIVCASNSGNPGLVLVPWSQIECLRVEEVKTLTKKDEEEAATLLPKKPKRLGPPVLRGDDPGPMLDIDAALGLKPE